MSAFIDIYLFCLSQSYLLYQAEAEFCNLSPREDFVKRFWKICQAFF